MATHAVDRSKHTTLTGGAEDIVNMNQALAVRVENRSATNPIFFTTDGSPAVQNADNSYIVMPNSGLTVSPGYHIRQIRLISAGAQAYSVMGL